MTTTLLPNFSLEVSTKKKPGTNFSDNFVTLHFQTVKLYVKKFNMPKINAYKDSQNRVICTPGYAFITTKDSWMAQELVKKGFIMMDGFKVEIKSIQAAKRLSSKKNEMEKKKRVRKQFEDDNKFAS